MLTARQKIIILTIGHLKVRGAHAWKLSQLIHSTCHLLGIVSYYMHVSPVMMSAGICKRQLVTHRVRHICCPRARGFEGVPLDICQWEVANAMGETAPSAALLILLLSLDTHHHAQDAADLPKFL